MDAKIIFQNAAIALSQDISAEEWFRILWPVTRDLIGLTYGGRS